jgi:aldehyde dehydrogenase (NAD+)
MKKIKSKKKKQPPSKAKKRTPKNRNFFITEIFNTQKEHSKGLRTATAKERIRKLKHLLNTILINQQKLKDAIYQDFKKPGEEVEILELIPAIADIKHTIRHLRRWMRPKRVKTPLVLMGTKSKIHYEPLGVCLIISPWNYPFYLAIAPLIAAISAGNCCIIKPSEFTPNTSRFLAQLIASVFPPEEIIVIEGDYKVSSFLTSLPFDHIFFTGSNGVGKLVMENASKNLASVTLELGGKSPVVVDSKIDLKIAASRILWGKILNAGQTCIAPDYLFLPESRLDAFLAEAKKAVNSFLSENPGISPDFCRIINAKHLKRIQKLVRDAVRGGAQIELGGEFNLKEKFISPTIITNVDKKSGIMNEEIFGPVLPIILYTDLREVIHHINNGEKPLAMYIFSRNKTFINALLKNTTSGGTCINDVILQVGNNNLPFGGVNQSGIGNYHGKFGFITFSHERAVMKQSYHSVISLLYPPYNKWVKKLINFIIKYLT